MTSDRGSGIVHSERSSGHLHSSERDRSVMIMMIMMMILMMIMITAALGASQSGPWSAEVDPGGRQ